MGCICSLPLLTWQTVKPYTRTDNDRLTPHIKSVLSVRCFMREWGRELGSKLMMEEIRWRRCNIFKICDSSAATTACWLSHVKEAFWNMLSLRICLSVTQSISSLCHVITPSEELLSPCIIMNNQISEFLSLMKNLNSSKGMDTNSKQVPSCIALPEVCLSVLCPFLKKTSLTSCSHLSIVSQEESSMVWNSAALKHMLKGQFTEEDAFLPAYSRKWFNF